MKKPTIVCLCGSTRFMNAFNRANHLETIAGNIVLTVGVDNQAAVFGIPPLLKKKLDALHKRKIDLSDEILVLNVGGYIGSSTRSEIRYATKTGKKIRYLEPV